MGAALAPKDQDTLESGSSQFCSKLFQWLRLRASNTGSVGSIPVQGTKIPHALRCGQEIKTGFLGGSDGKESGCNVGDLGLIPGSGRSPGEGNGYPLQYSCLQNSMDREAWWAAVHGVTKSRT